MSVRKPARRTSPRKPGQSAKIIPAPLPKIPSARRNYFYAIPAVIACLLGAFLLWQRFHQGTSPSQQPQLFTTSSANGQKMIVGRDVPRGARATSGGNSILRSVHGSLYKAYRTRTEGDPAVSGNGRYALAFARCEDSIEEKGAPFTQKIFPAMMAEYWDSDFDAPVWKKELQLDLLTQPKLDDRGQAYFVCIEPNIEAEGMLKIASIGGDGKLGRQWSLDKIRTFGFNSPSLTGTAVSSDGRYFAATFWRSKDVLKREPMRFLTFFFDLEKKRMWTDKREWEGLAIDEKGMVSAPGAKRPFSAGEALAKHGLPME